MLYRTRVALPVIVSIQANNITDLQDFLNDMAILRLRRQAITEIIAHRVGGLLDDRLWTKLGDTKSNNKRNGPGELCLLKGRRCDDRVT